MHKYLVRYAFKHVDSALRPADQMWGFSVMVVEIDKEPTTNEDFKEIAKQLFRTKNDCEELRVIDIIDASTLPFDYAENIEKYVPGEILD